MSQTLFCHSEKRYWACVKRNRILKNVKLKNGHMLKNCHLPKLSSILISNKYFIKTIACIKGGWGNSGFYHKVPILIFMKIYRKLI